jgi:histidinol-phosphate aminotransferase
MSGFSVRPGYELINAYRVDRPVVAIDLSDNTNQWGVAPSALAALGAWTTQSVSEYPSLYSDRLAAAAGAYVGVPPESVVCGCGSDDLLDSAMRALAQPGDVIAHPAPSFAMIPIFARTNGLTPVGVPLLPNGDLDADAMLATDARILYLCTPNNPTGTAHSRQAVERVLREARGIVILDEAYGEFADEAFTADAVRYPNVFATRTLSKSFGLAGLRIGFGVGAPALVAEVTKARGPYKVNSFAEMAATAALTQDLAWMAGVAAEVQALRARFSDALRAIGLAPLPSQANFVCVPVPDARRVVEALYGRGIALRGLVGLPGIGDALRIGLAPWETLEQVLVALEEVLPCA